MNRAELPESMNSAADDLMRQVAGQRDTEVLNLRELEDFLGAPREAGQSGMMPVVESADTTVVPSYETMSRAQRLKELSHLNVLVRSDPDLRQYMSEVFPEGYENSDPALRLYTYRSYQEDKKKSEVEVIDERILEALQYQADQLAIRKHKAANAIWAENAAVVFVAEMEEKVEELYQRDVDEAYAENNQRKAQARAEVVKQRAARDIETYLELEDFVAACEAANYAVTEITNQKPEFAVLTLRRLLNEWEKNGVIEPKPQDTEVAMAPVALATLKKAFQLHKQKVAPTPPVTPVIAAETAISRDSIEESTIVISDVPFVTQSAGARAFAELADPLAIKKIDVAALDGGVVQSFAIERKGQA